MFFGGCGLIKEIVPFVRAGFSRAGRVSVFIKYIGFYNIKNLLGVYITTERTFALIPVGMLHSRFKVDDRLNGIAVVY